jgi:AcrR family transcriptional regulator
MVLTPWGDSSELRERKLRPGRGIPPEEAERNRRERLLAAMVATVAEKGYEATTVADVLKLSGVSGSAFYSQFEDKEACFLAALEGALEASGSELHDRLGGPLNAQNAEAGLVALLGLIAEQPAAARALLIESYTAGSEAANLLKRHSDAIASGLAGAFEERGQGRMPPQIVRALIGGVLGVIGKRLQRGEEAELRGLAGEVYRWVFSYGAPPGPLKPPRRRGITVASFEERQASSDVAERLLRALGAEAGERGCLNTSVQAISTRARTSERSFYESFPGRDEVLAAGVDLAFSQMLAVALPAYRRAQSWPTAVRDAYEAILGFSQREPELARLGLVEGYAGSAATQVHAERMIGELEGLLAPGYRAAPDASPIAAEAASRAIASILYEQARGPGTKGLPKLLALITYIALAPFLGAEEAYATATS